MTRTLSPQGAAALEALEALIWSAGKKEVTPPHGPNGLLTNPAARPDMYNLTPRVGNWTQSLPMFESLYTNADFEFITGVTAQSGSNPADTCGTPMTSGKMKIATIRAPFGTFYKRTDQIKVAEAGQRRNRSDVNRRLRNSAPDLGNPFIPTPPDVTAESFNTVLGKAFLEFGQGALLDFALVDWQGDTSKTNAQTHPGFIKEYTGLDGWIKTGWTDIDSGNPVSSLNSQVRNFNATLGEAFVTALVDMYRTLLTEAELKGTPNVEWEILVHPRAKFALFDIWACNYATARCLPSSSNGRTLDVGQVTELRDQMLRGNYLLIDGEQVRVSTDAAIAATQAEDTGVWNSDVYILPMDDGNGNALVYREFLPYDNANPDVTEIVAAAGGAYRVINNGFYIMTWEKQSFCIDYRFTAKARIILERPDLAGRLDNVQFTSATPFTDPIPGSTYHRNGGTTWRAG